MAHIGAQTIDYVILGVGAVSLVLTVLAVRSYLRARNPKLLFVVAAFALFVLKSVVAVYAIAKETIAHEDLEMVLALFDLAIVLSLVSPFFVRKPAPARRGAGE